MTNREDEDFDLDELFEDDDLLLEDEDDEIYFDSTPKPPKANTTIWGSPQRQKGTNVQITAVNHGFTATASIIIDDGSKDGALLYAVSVADSNCDLDHAMNKLVPNAIAITGAWLRANEEEN